MHCHRWYRHGSVDKVMKDKGISVRKSRRYKSRYMPPHPRASKHGIVYAHRQVLYDTVGEEDVACHWCGKALDWRLPNGNAHAVVVDHLNGVGGDNRPENPALSCPQCNSDRGLQERCELALSRGYWPANDARAHLAHEPRKNRQYA
jgi:hypothetical protein